MESATLTQQPAASQADITTMDDLTSQLTDDISLEADVASINPMEEIDVGQAVSFPVAPSNTPITADSGQASPVNEVSSDGLSDDCPKENAAKSEEAGETPLSNGQAKVASPAAASQQPNGAVTANGTTTATTRESKKEEKRSSNSGSKSKKREDKGGIDSILRALNSLNSQDEKLAAICKRYADLHEEHRVLQSSFKTQQRSIAGLARERDQISSEHAKSVIAKGRLESLCRELQKHNRLVKEESVQRAKEDEEKRKELSAKFQTTIGEIQTQMNSNNERNGKLQEENMSLAKQLEQFVKQYEIREQKVRQHRDLEQQVAEAKLAKADAILKEEQERNAREKEILLHKTADSNRKVTLLEAQVRVFKERYDEFESLHTRSNETFQKYKTEMDKMGKRVKKLEKDGLAWKNKWDATNKSLIQATDARSKSEQETKTWVQKTKTLESLCRALQEKLRGNAVASEIEQSKETVSPPASGEVPPNSPEVSSSSGQTSPDSTAAPSEPTPAPEVVAPSNSQTEPETSEATAAADTSATPAPQVSSSSSQLSVSSPSSSTGNEQTAPSESLSPSPPSTTSVSSESMAPQVSSLPVATAPANEATVS